MNDEEARAYHAAHSKRLRSQGDPDQKAIREMERGLRRRTWRHRIKRPRFWRKVQRG